jgi:signal transduction histidine kinase
MGMSIVALGVSILYAFFIGKRITSPLVRLSQEVRKAGKNENYEIKTDGNAYVELDDLARSLNVSLKEQQKTEHFRRDLVANVSHDLRTPLTMIKAYAEMIRDISGGVKAKRDKHTNVIIEEADRLTLLVNDILSLSRLQSSVDVLEKTTFNLSELTENVLYRFETVVKEQGYTIIKDIEPDLYINGDEKKIEEVIYNLIGNSINYTGEDKTVKVYLKKSGYSAVMEVLDSGKGMDSEQINTIWEKYYRVSETHHRAVKGTGLGLSIVKTILESHGLKFGVLSKPGVGSNFYVEFTLVDENDGGTSNE